MSEIDNWEKYKCNKRTYDIITLHLPLDFSSELVEGLFLKNLQQFTDANSNGKCIAMIPCVMISMLWCALTLGI